MHCNNLVETLCDDPCDWENAFNIAHDLSSLPDLCKDPLFVKDADEMKCTILQALFLTHSVSESSVLPNTTCCVIGCNGVFPEPHKNGWSYTLNYGQKKSKQIKIEGLCHKHFDRMNQKRKNAQAYRKKIIYGEKQNSLTILPDVVTSLPTIKL